MLDDSSSRVSLEQADSHLSVNSGAKIYRESHLTIWNKLETISCEIEVSTCIRLFQFVDCVLHGHKFEVPNGRNM